MTKYEFRLQLPSSFSRKGVGPASCFCLSFDALISPSIAIFENILPIVWLRNLLQFFILYRTGALLTQEVALCLLAQLSFLVWLSLPFFLLYFFTLLPLWTDRIYPLFYFFIFFLVHDSFFCTFFFWLDLYLFQKLIVLQNLAPPQILNFNLWVSYLILSSVMWALRFVNFGCLPLIVYFEGLNFFPFLVFFFYQNQFQLLLSRGPLSRACPLCRATKVLAGCSLYKGLLPSGISHHFFSHNPFQHISNLQNSVAFTRLLAALIFMMMGGPLDEQGGELLDGDGTDMIMTALDGPLMCAPHHYDWAGVAQEATPGADGSTQRSMYRDVPLLPLPDEEEWLLMEPFAHEIRRRTRGRFALNMFA